MDELIAASNSEITSRNYWFHDVAACNMCGAAAAEATILGLRLDKSQGRQPRGKRGIAVSVCRCAACGLIFANPQPVPRSISDHYGIPPEAYWRTVRLEPDPSYFAWQIDTAKRLLGFRPGMTAIDIGAGLGKATRAMMNAGFDVYGIEPSEPFHRKALELLRVGEDRIKLCSIGDAEFEAGAYDFVTFGAVLEHVYDSSAALAKALRWLKPGGVIHAEVPNSRHLISKIINFYYRIAGTSFVTNISPMHVPFHLYEFSLESFQQNGARNGYSIVEHRFDVCSIYNIPRLFHPLLRAIMTRNETGMQLTVWLRKD